MDFSAHQRAPIVAKIRLETQGSEKNIFFMEPETIGFVGTLILNGEIIWRSSTGSMLEPASFEGEVVRASKEFIASSAWSFTDNSLLR